MNCDFDAVIIGGGLAGSMVGILFRQRGWKVLILEKSHYPRNKVCGEFLSPAVGPFLKQAGLSHLLKEEQRKEIDTVSFFWPLQKPVHAKIPHGSAEYPYACGISRKTLDDLLLREAENRGCQIHQNEEAVRIQRKQNYFPEFTVHTRRLSGDAAYPSKLVIDAAGRQNAPSPFPLPQGERARVGGKRTFGFKAHFKNISAGRSTELYFFEGGYLGILEIEGGLSNVCGKVEEKWLKKTQGNFDLLLQRAGLENPALARRMKEAKRETEWFSCGPLVEQFKKGYENGIFYAGDAASFVEPFLGQGMTMAIAGAFVLASILTKLPEDENGLNKTGRDYDKKLKRFYKAKLSLGSFFNPFAFSPLRGFWLHRFFSAFPSALNSLLQKIGTLQGPRVQ